MDIPVNNGSVIPLQTGTKLSLTAAEVHISPPLREEGMGLVRVANVEGSLEGNMTLVRWLAMTSRLAREGRRLGSLHLRDCLAQKYRGRGLAVSRRPGCH